MKMHQLLAGTALAAALALGTGPAMAVPIDLGGYTGPVQIKFNNFESFTGTAGIAVSSNNFGIISVSAITTPGGTNLWTQGKSGQFLAGVFNNLHVDTIVPNVSGGFDTTNSGGALNVYLLPVFNPDVVAAQGLTGYATAGCAPNGTCYNGITNVPGEELALTLVFAPGQTPIATTTLTSSFSGTGNAITGTAAGYLNIPRQSLGLLYVQTARWNEAFEAFEGILKTDPRSPGALYQIGKAGAVS